MLSSTADLASSIALSTFYGEKVDLSLLASLMLLDLRFVLFSTLIVVCDQTACELVCLQCHFGGVVFIPLCVADQLSRAFSCATSFCVVPLSVLAFACFLDLSGFRYL